MNIPSITITEARNMLAKYIAAEQAVLKNQSYTIGTRTYTRASLTSIRNGRKGWQNIVDQMSGTGGMKVRRVLPRDDY